MRSSRDTVLGEKSAVRDEVFNTASSPTFTLWCLTPLSVHLHLFLISLVQHVKLAPAPPLHRSKRHLRRAGSRRAPSDSSPLLLLSVVNLLLTELSASPGPVCMSTLATPPFPSLRPSSSVSSVNQSVRRPRCRSLLLNLSSYTSRF